MKVWIAGDSPTLIKYNTNGSVEEVYLRDGKRHRGNGPAVVRRNADGSTIDEEYYRDGVQENPLLTGLRLPAVKSGQEAVDALLHEAIAEQEAPGKPGGRNGREYVPLPRP